MSAAQPLLSAAVRQLSRSAYGAIIKPARGFQVFRIDGYSWAKTIPAGVCISSGHFAVGGRNWQIDCYPNGSDTTNKDSISVYLRAGPSEYHCQSKKSERVGVDYKFTLLDHSGKLAYDLPADTGVVKFPSISVHRNGGYGSEYSAEEIEEEEEEEDCDVQWRVGHAEFIAMEELERRRETLLKDDSLAIRCDVGVTEMGVLDVAPKESQLVEGSARDGTSKRRRQPKPLDDEEYIRRFLAKNRGA